MLFLFPGMLAGTAHKSLESVGCSLVPLSRCCIGFFLLRWALACLLHLVHSALGFTTYAMHVDAVHVVFTCYSHAHVLNSHASICLHMSGLLRTPRPRSRPR
jgi:hypothetical protein